MLTWQTWILTAIAALTLPLYLRIIYILIRYQKRNRFKSHFYTITLSQGCIDVMGFLSYYSCYNMRGFDELKPFYWSMNNSFFVPWSYMQTYIFQYGRIIGVVLISIQRCAIVSFPTSKFNQVFNSLPAWVFFITQWCFPILLCLNMFFVDMHFDNAKEMNVVIDKGVLTGHYLKTAIISLSATIICGLCYVCVIRRIKESTLQKGKKELHLCIQVVGLLVALVIICIHFCLQFIFNYKNMPEMVYAMRSYLPLWIGFLTFINPWMILIVNKDVRTLALFQQVATETTTIAYKHSIIKTSKK